MSGVAFTCITCQVAFADADLQRTHYKTDWHRYNLKRKVANLPPVTAEGFNQRVLAQRAQVAISEEKETSFYCEPCKKKISSEAAYKNHIASSKHKLNVAKLMEQPRVKRTDNSEQVDKPEKSDSQLNADKMEDEEDMDEEMEEWDDNQMGIEECLFCSNISKSLVKNVKHMTTEHSFFIPDIDYLVDLEGLIGYLGEKVAQGKMCLWCNDRSKLFRTTRAAQQHMVGKGHCMLLYEGDSVCEYADYYDYTTSYPDNSEGNDPDQVVSPNILEVDDELQLTLPSGAKIGHRALARYYKQNLVSRTNPEGKAMVSKLKSHYLSLGWTGATGPLVEKRVKDLQYMQRTKHKHHQQLGVKANKTSQKHFRYQYMF